VASARVKEFGVNFVLRNYQDVIAQPAFETLEPTLLVEIMRLYQQFAAKYKPPAPTKLEIPPNNLAEELGRLRHDDKSYDFFFQARGKQLGAHLVMLYARTGFFQSAFRSAMKGGEVHTRQMEVLIGTVKPIPGAFSRFLDFLYTGQAEMLADEAVYLLTASGYYGLTNDRLKVLCSKQIVKKINKDNLLYVLDAANDICARQLKDFVLGEIVKDLPHIMRKQAELVRELDKDLLVDIMAAIAAARPPASSRTSSASSIAPPAQASPATNASAPSSPTAASSTSSSSSVPTGVAASAVAQSDPPATSSSSLTEH